MKKIRTNTHTLTRTHKRNAKDDEKRWQKRFTIKILRKVATVANSETGFFRAAHGICNKFSSSSRVAGPHELVIIMVVTIACVEKFIYKFTSGLIAAFKKNPS